MASVATAAHTVRDTVIVITAKLQWHHFDINDGLFMNAQQQNTVKRVFV